ncbi:hypothetical protein COOFOMLJ_03046 [Aeromonas veronii]
MGNQIDLFTPIDELRVWTICGLKYRGGVKLELT